MIRQRRGAVEVEEVGDVAVAVRDVLPALVEGAMGDGTTLLNPREASEEDYVELYRRAL